MKVASKLIKVGNSRAVTLMAPWLNALEADGKEVTEVEMDYEDDRITIRPKKEEVQKDAA